MKRTFTTFLALALLATLAPAAFADNENDEKCSNATMQGKYIFSFSGWYTFGSPLDLSKAFLYNIVGISKFDGAGHFTTTFNSCFNGACSPGSGSGTYVINPDCSTTAQIGTATYFGTITSDGKTEYVVETDPGSNVSGTVTKQ